MDDGSGRQSAQCQSKELAVIWTHVVAAARIAAAIASMDKLVDSNWCKSFANT